MSYEYTCASYSRLSREDDKEEKKDDSESILTQKMIIQSFAKFNNLEIVKEYQDDGYSGGNFDRPGFQNMIEDIEKGLINCVITKDLSRLGREIYGTGTYIEQYFLVKNVRYIAINDSFDSNIGDSMLGIRLGVNDLYLRDGSKKVRSALKIRQEQGKFIGSYAPYGYIKNPDNHNHLLIDEESSNIVKQIFDWCESGVPYNQIAERLTLRKVPIPIVYKKEFRAKKVIENDSFGLWRTQTVKAILTNRVYIGDMVQRKHSKLSYNNKKLNKLKESENIVVENTHEPIISKEQFEIVQKQLNKKVIVQNRNKEKYLLQGLIKCKDCGHTISLTTINRRGKPEVYGQCTMYTKFGGKIKKCTSHSISYKSLEEDIIAYIYQVVHSFLKNYDYEKLLSKMRNTSTNELEILNKEINSTNKKIKEEVSLIESLYIDKAKGVITENTYLSISEKHEELLKELKLILKNIELKLSKLDKQEDKVDSKSLIENIKDILEKGSLDREFICKIIDKIEVDQDKNIEVYFKIKVLNYTTV